MSHCGVIPFRTPCSIVVAGPSSSGKSTFLKKLFQHLPCMFDVQFKSILWLYGEESAKPIDLDTHGIPFRTYAGIPSEWKAEELGLISPALIILEDLLEQVFSANSNILELWTKLSHHRQWTNILISQNYFYQSKISRTISLNTHYFVLMKSLRDKSQFAHLARQIEPHHSKELEKAYSDALSTNYSYFLIDLHPASPFDALRYRTCIFPTDEACLIWTTQDKLEKLKQYEETFEFA